MATTMVWFLRRIGRANGIRDQIPPECYWTKSDRRDARVLHATRPMWLFSDSANAALGLLEAAQRLDVGECEVTHTGGIVEGRRVVLELVGHGVLDLGRRDREDLIAAVHSFSCDRLYLRRVPEAGLEELLVRHRTSARVDIDHNRAPRGCAGLTPPVAAVLPEVVVLVVAAPGEPFDELPHAETTRASTTASVSAGTAVSFRIASAPSFGKLRSEIERSSGWIRGVYYKASKAMITTWLTTMDELIRAT